MHITKVYFKHLDSLRFFAFLNVFFFHSFYTDLESIKQENVYIFFHQLTRFGWLGVNFFFVLSGFLITYLILKEEEYFGFFNLKWFYIRRLLRIWPLYYLIVGLCFLVYPAIVQAYSDKAVILPDFWLFLLHLSNYSYIHFPSDIPTLNILWSVSIEEQFYLLWPLVLYLVKGKKRFFVFIALILISIFFSWMYRGDFHFYHHHLLSCMADLTLGGLAALLIVRSDRFRGWIEDQSPLSIILSYLVITLYFGGVVGHLIDNNRIITALIFVYIILEQNYSKHSFYKLSKVPFVTTLGRYTYGLYCYHYFALLVAIKISQHLGWNTSLTGVLLVENLVALCISIAAAFISFHLFEKPFLKLKGRFSNIVTGVKIS